MTLTSKKKDLKTKVSRYMTLLSNLSRPDVGFIVSLEYFKGLVDFANHKEIGGLESRFLSMLPEDDRSRDYIETGELRAVESDGT
jgi:hypothetical protein